MAKIQCKISDLQYSKYECDRTGYLNLKKICKDVDNDCCVIDTKEFNLLNFNDIFDQQGHFIIDVDSGLPMALSISISDKNGLSYDEEYKNFYITYILKKRLSTDNDYSNIETKNIKIPEDEFCNALLFCAYIDKKLDITKHPAMADRLQEIIDNYISVSEKYHKCIDYKIVQRLFLKVKRSEIKVLLTDESIQDNPRVLSFSQIFRISFEKNILDAEINNLDATTLKASNNVSVYIIDKYDNLCFRLACNCHIDYHPIDNTSNTMISVFFNNKNKLLDKDISDYFNNNIKPEIEIYNASSPAERISVTLMDDLFDW